ncbi:histone-lysine N-methyltransferase SETMAR [Trichonephila clavipes]|nr:histone-lysine N-methyltransferase SETMAR [Trichonephila clavipes]
MGKQSKTSRDANGVFGMDRNMSGRPHAQKRAEALIKSAVQLTLLVEFLEYRRIIDEYYETLRSLRRFMKNKRPGLLTEGVVLLHDNARSHVSRITHVELDKFKLKQLDHLPYHPGMSPCDLHAFDPLKKHLKGRYFNSDMTISRTL